MLILKISGKHIENFIKKLYDNKINIYKIKKIDRTNIFIYIKKEDLEKINKLKKIYEIEITGKTGFLLLKEILEKNTILIISIIIGMLTVYILGNIIFDIDIITSNKNLKEELTEELKVNGIYKYSFKKKYEELNNIKNSILKKYHSNIEWLEIENIGTRCILKLEERIKNENKNVEELVDIVSLKDAIIMDVKASKGVILKRKGISVKKGETVISGKIYLNEELKEVVGASGKVMGEVWYKTKVSYPLTYYEEKLTGKTYTRFSINIFNKEINLFKKNGKIEKKPIIKSNIFSLYKNTIHEVEIIDNVYNYDEAIEKAMILSKKNIESKLNDEEYIIYEKCLKVSLNDSKIELEVFYAVCENITGYERIDIND